MGKKILTFGDTDIEKNEFYHHKFPIFKKKYKNYKYFISYLYNDHKVKSLHIMLPKTSAYVKSYDRQTKWMYFFDCR